MNLRNVLKDSCPKFCCLAIALVLPSTLFQQSALAGWVSSGGELFSTDNNAWFIQNTDVIDYCILIDEDNFGVTLEQANKQIHLAWTYWKKQVSNSEINTSGDALKLATQDLNKVDCDAATDIKFLFGVEPIVPRETKFDPSKTIGRAIRTAYDSKILKAKGFIYISPERGPLALDLELGFFGRNAENRWRVNEGLILRGVLIHELGHVLGIEHHGGYFSEPTSKAFPAYIVSSIAANDFEQNGTRYWPDVFPAYITKFRPQGVVKNEYQKENLEKYLKAPKTTKSWNIIADKHSLIMQITLTDGTLMNLGRLNYVSADIDTQSVGYFYYPDEQEIIESFKPGMNMVKPVLANKKNRYKFELLGTNNFRRLIELKLNHNNEGDLVDALTNQPVGSAERTYEAYELKAESKVTALIPRRILK